MTDVITLGETMGTVRLSGPLTLGASSTCSLAGSESNVAIGLARLGHRAAWIGCLGRDAFGDGILRVLRGEQVDTSFVERRDLPTGLLVSRPAGLGTKTVDYHRSGSAGRQISLDQVRRAFASAPRFLHISGITPALGDAMLAAAAAAIDAARECGATVSFDVNHRSRLWSEADARPVLASFAERADIVIGGSRELLLLSGAADLAGATETLLGAGVGEVVWKEATAASVTSSAGCIEVPGITTQVVDTIGAGDGFVAGYLSGHLDGLDDAERLRRAHLVASFVVSQAGDWEGLPSREQFDAAAVAFTADAFDSGAVQR